MRKGRCPPRRLAVDQWILHAFQFRSRSFESSFAVRMGTTGGMPAISIPLPPASLQSGLLRRGEAGDPSFLLAWGITPVSHQIPDVSNRDTGQPPAFDDPQFIGRQFAQLAAVV